MTETLPQMRRRHDLSPAVVAANEAKRNPVVVRGQYFESQKDAAAYFGVTSSAVSNSLRRCGHLENLGTKSRPIGNTNAIACPVKIYSRQFKSIKNASEVIGVSRQTIRRFLNGELSMRSRETFLSKAMKVIT